MANFVYKENRITKMTIKGIIDTDNMTINVDDVDKSIATLLSDFNGGNVSITVKVQEDFDLDEPVADED